MGWPRRIGALILISIFAAEARVHLSAVYKTNNRLFDIQGKFADSQTGQKADYLLKTDVADLKRWMTKDSKSSLPQWLFAKDVQQLIDQTLEIRFREIDGELGHAAKGRHTETALIELTTLKEFLHIHPDLHPSAPLQKKIDALELRITGSLAGEAEHFLHQGSARMAAHKLKELMDFSRNYANPTTRILISHSQAKLEKRVTNAAMKETHDLQRKYYKAMQNHWRFQPPYR